MTGTQQQSEIIEAVSSKDSDLVRDVKQDEKSRQMMLRSFLEMA